MHALVIVVIAVLAVGGPPVPAPGPGAVAAIPDEPGVASLPDSQPTLQAVAADLDGDGARELVRLVPDAAGVLVVEAWREGSAGWERAGRPAATSVGDDGQVERSFIGSPMRLLVRTVGGDDRVTLVRQPDLAVPDQGFACCLLIDDVRLTAEGPRLVPVAERQARSDAVHAIDFDGDGTDELLVTRSLPPLGDVSYPTDARVYRWGASAFGEPTTTELPIGSGDTPFVLGDTDGVPGDEAGIISVTGRPDLYRLTLDAGDVLHAEAAGLVATDALGVPFGTGRGIAVTGPVVGLGVAPWPSGGPIGAFQGVAAQDARLVGLADGGARARLVAVDGSGAPLLLGLPDLHVVDPGPIRSPAAAELEGGPIHPFVGGVPGGGRDGRPAVIAWGWLHAGGQMVEMATLAGAEAVGFVGRDRTWLAVHHAPTSGAPLDPRGGRLDPPSFAPFSSVRLVPVDLALAPETDGGRYAPGTFATELASGALAVPPAGFVVDVEAPPGSLVYLADPGAQDPGPAREIDESGSRRVVVAAPAGPAGTSEERVSMIVVTPAGRAYRTEWRLDVVDGPPELRAGARTPFGSSEVAVVGRTEPYASVTVDGAPAAVDVDGRFEAVVSMPPWPTEVGVVARDPFGGVSTLVVTGIGLFDYRSLPWVPMVAALATLGGAFLFLRVPRVRADPAPVTDDAVLEELDPDEPG